MKKKISELNLKPNQSAKKLTQPISNVMCNEQGRRSNQCHCAMARVDILPRSLETLSLSFVFLILIKKPQSLGSGTGCLYCRSAPLAMR